MEKKINVLKCTSTCVLFLVDQSFVNLLWNEKFFPYFLELRVCVFGLTDLWTCTFLLHSSSNIGSLFWSETMILLILTPGVNFGEVRRAHLATSTLLTFTLMPLGFFRYFKVCSDVREREWGTESNGKLPHLFIPSKTATLVPGFAVMISVFPITHERRGALGQDLLGNTSGRNTNDIYDELRAYMLS